MNCKIFMVNQYLKIYEIIKNLNIICIKDRMIFAGVLSKVLSVFYHYLSIIII